MANNDDKGTDKKYDYLKEDFLAAARLAVKVGKKASRKQKDDIADIIFSATGKVVELATGLVDAFRPAPDLVIGVARGSDRARATDPTPSTIKSYVQKEANDSVIEIRTLVEEDILKIVVNISKLETGVEVRPFTLSVQDDQCGELLSPIVVEAGELPPKLPDPKAGIYAFLLEWEDKQEKIRIEVR